MSCASLILCFVFVYRLGYTITHPLFNFVQLITCLCYYLHQIEHNIRYNCGILNVVHIQNCFRNSVPKENIMTIVILEDDATRVAMMLAHCISPETIICASLHMHEGVIVVTLSALWL